MEKKSLTGLVGPSCPFQLLPLRIEASFALLHKVSKSCPFFIALFNRSDVSLLCKDVRTESQCQLFLLEAPGLLSLSPCFRNRVSWQPTVFHKLAYQFCMV